MLNLFTFVAFSVTHSFSQSVTQPFVNFLPNTQESSLTKNFFEKSLYFLETKKNVKRSAEIESEKEETLNSNSNFFLPEKNSELSAYFPNYCSQEHMHLLLNPSTEN